MILYDAGCLLRCNMGALTASGADMPTPILTATGLCVPDQNISNAFFDERFGFSNIHHLPPGRGKVQERLD